MENNDAITDEDFAYLNEHIDIAKDYDWDDVNVNILFGTDYIQYRNFKPGMIIAFEHSYEIKYVQLRTVSGDIVLYHWKPLLAYVQEHDYSGIPILK